MDDLCRVIERDETKPEGYRDVEYISIHLQDDYAVLECPMGSKLSCEGRLLLPRIDEWTKLGSAVGRSTTVRGLTVRVMDELWMIQLGG
jgi:hypothetical protein